MYADDCSTQDLDIYFDAGDLTNLGAGCNIISFVEVDPASLPAPPNEAAALLCDISLPAGVTITPGRTVTVALGIRRPERITLADFEANLKIYYYNGVTGNWKVIARTGDGSATINWDDAIETTGTATFETDHLSTFAATSESVDTGGGDSGDSGTQSTSSGGGGCSVAPTVVNISSGPALINVLIFLLPLIGIKIRRRI